MKKPKYPGEMISKANKKKPSGGKWIQSIGMKKGALHRELGVPQGKKIPGKMLAKAAHAGGKLGARARLAETLKGMHKGKKSAKKMDTMTANMKKKHGVKKAKKSLVQWAKEETRESEHKAKKTHGKACKCKSCAMKKGKK